MKKNPTADFYGVEFEVDLNLFATEFGQFPGVYIVYTPKSCLDIGITENLKVSIETHKNTRDWMLSSKGEEVYVAFHLDVDQQSRVKKEKHLRENMNPICGCSS